MFARISTRRCTLLAGLFGALVLSGCPTELGVPDASGQACETSVECNGDVTCGELRACVIGRCEVEPSLLVPCDAGQPIDAFIPDAGVR